MQLRGILIFLSQSITVGLVAALLVLLLKPELLQESRPVVEVRESGVPTASPAAMLPSFADAVEKAAPSVVNIYSTKVVERRPSLLDDPLFRRFFDGNPAVRPRRQLETSLGSGVLFSRQGYVITSNHVIAGADEIEILLRDGRSTRATLVGSDPDTDLAVLKVDLDDLPAIVLGDSTAMRVGDVVLAIGNPFGVGQTVTLGIVSATGRKRLGLSTFENFIQTDAAINPGNSGGALINPAGELIGINTAIYSRTGGSQGIGFAIPVDLAKEVMTEIIEHGRVIRGWIGVSINNVTPRLAEAFHLREVRGVVLAGIYRDSPAARAGLRQGDILLEFNGEPLIDARDLLERVARQKPGSVIRLGGLRGEKGFIAELTVAERPRSR
ncbi:MAG TPA: trypsin-like serine protease [Thiotrichales bacterium]|nr:trypsin-like serine protease [Thiotrichales bacterium]